MMHLSTNTATLRSTNTPRKINQTCFTSRELSIILKKIPLHWLKRLKNFSKGKTLNGILSMSMLLSTLKLELGLMSPLPLMKKLFKPMNYSRTQGLNLEMDLFMVVSET